MLSGSTSPRNVNFGGGVNLGGWRHLNATNETQRGAGVSHVHSFDQEARLFDHQGARLFSSKRRTKRRASSELTPCLDGLRVNVVWAARASSTGGGLL